ncbi:MAG: hypothetical protein STHCBS139747_005153 [Sporothrix thermara]
MATIASRACKGCSQLKVRCQPSPQDAKSCERCLHAGRECIRADKRRRPRDRIAELEAQVAALSRALQKQQLSSKGAVSADDTPSTTDGDGGKSSSSISSPSAASLRTPSMASVIASNAVYSFSSDRPPGETAMAFLDARISLAAQQRALDLYIKRFWKIELLREVMCMFAVEIISKPNRCLDTVWALLVACFWFRAQHGSAHVTVHQLTQMATSMAIELGIGGAQVPAADKNDADRAWLAYYMMTSYLAINIRQPDSNAQWTPGYHDQCLDSLTRAAASTQTNEPVFLHMVRGQRLCQQVADAVQLCDSGVIWDLTSTAAQQTAATMQMAIDSWTAETTTQLFSQGTPVGSLDYKMLMVYRHMAVIFLHEPVLHTPTNKSTFCAPFRPEKLAENDIAAPAVVTGPHVASLYALKDACLALLNLAMTSENVDGNEHYYREDCDDDNSITAFLVDCPLPFIAKFFHAFFVLVKLHIAVTAPGNTYGAILRPGELRLSQYPARLKALASVVERRNPGSFQSRILSCGAGTNLGDWFSRYEAARARGFVTVTDTDTDTDTDTVNPWQLLTPPPPQPSTDVPHPDVDTVYFLNPSTIPSSDNNGMAAYLAATYGQAVADNDGFDVDNAQWQVLDRYLSSFDAPP